MSFIITQRKGRASWPTSKKEKDLLNQASQALRLDQVPYYTHDRAKEIMFDDNLGDGGEVTYYSDEEGEEDDIVVRPEEQKINQKTNKVVPSDKKVAQSKVNSHDKKIYSSGKKYVLVTHLGTSSVEDKDKIKETAFRQKHPWIFGALVATAIALVVILMVTGIVGSIYGPSKLLMMVKSFITNKDTLMALGIIGAPTLIALAILGLYIRERRKADEKAELRQNVSPEVSIVASSGVRRIVKEELRKEIPG